MILDDTFFHLHRPRTKGKDRVTPVVQQLCLPRTLRDEVIKAYYDHNGHIGFDKLYVTIRSKYFWPHMYADLTEYVKICKECQETKRPIHSKKALLKSLPVKMSLLASIWTFKDHYHHPMHFSICLSLSTARHSFQKFIQPNVTLTKQPKYSMNTFSVVIDVHSVS